jgi:hypothetical protein
MSESDEKPAFNLPTKPTWMTFCGKPGMGKSHAMRFIIQETMRSDDPFYFGVVFVKTKFNGEWSKNKNDTDPDAIDFIDEKYVNPQYAVGDVFTVERLHAYIQRLEQYQGKTGKKHPKNFVVMDDLQGQRDVYNPLMESIVASYRHTNTHFFVSTQYLNKGTSTSEREVSVYNFLYQSESDRNLKSWFEWFGQKCDSQDDFKALLDSVADTEKHDVLLHIGGKKTKRETFLKWRAGLVDPKFKVIFPGDKAKAQQSKTT